jgi:hypothetical protein
MISYNALTQVLVSQDNGEGHLYASALLQSCTVKEAKHLIYQYMYTTFTAQNHTPIGTYIDVVTIIKFLVHSYLQGHQE